MLSTVNVRALCVSKWSLPAKLSTKRQASLTGAIRRGARRTSAIRDRAERVYAAYNPSKQTDSERYQPRSPHITPLGGGRSWKRQPVEFEDRIQRKGTTGYPQIDNGRSRATDSEKDNRWDPRQSREDRLGSSLGRLPDHSARTDGFNRSVTRKSSLREKYMRSLDSTQGRSEKVAKEFGRDHQMPDNDFDGEEVQGSFSRKSPGRQRPFHTHETVDNTSDDGSREKLPAKRRSMVPLSIPRSSAASEFIYGSSAVKAALEANTRKLYKLYVFQGSDGTEERDGDRAFFRLAAKQGVVVKRVSGEGLRLLDKMAQGRPHNGFVLEASQLPSTPVEAFDAVESPGSGFSFVAGHQSAEEIALNSSSTWVSSSSRRYPFVLLLDSILDPGNLGAIIRSAAFFGVDAVALVDHNLAPFSPVTLKASAGAAEHTRFLRIKRDVDFIKRSQTSGWTFFAAIAPESASAQRGAVPPTQSNDVKTALSKGPCVLVLGGEGEGIRPRLQRIADRVVGIKGAGDSNSQRGLDSLNVSVAAALLVQRFVTGASNHTDLESSGPEATPEEDDERIF